MRLNDEIVISHSKAKITLSAVGSLVFVIGGAWLLGIAINNPGIESIILAAISVVTILFFGMILIYLLTRFGDQSPGLLINSQGIIDRSSAVAVGLIPWEEITGYSVKTARGQSFLAIHVRHPERFMNERGWIKRMLLRGNQRLYGSPIQISSNTLAVNFSQLVTTVDQQFDRFARFDQN
ncbi:MAG: STM3941 family protein [Ardenticatenaceae bacterium]|nr:STM3941 family protein [Ardenticatenaceae bacterium]